MVNPKRLVILGSIPIAIVGLIFKEQIEGTFTKNLWVIATMMIVEIGPILSAAGVGWPLGPAGRGA